MATLQQRIAEKFLAQLAESKEVSAEKVEKLRTALSAGKKPKVDDIVKIFTEPDHGDVK
jgi:DNA-binding phage protein